MASCGVGKGKAKAPIESPKDGKWKDVGPGSSRWIDDNGLAHMWKWWPKQWTVDEGEHMWKWWPTTLHKGSLRRDEYGERMVSIMKDIIDFRCEKVQFPNQSSQTKVPKPKLCRHVCRYCSR